MPASQDQEGRQQQAGSQSLPTQGLASQVQQTRDASTLESLGKVSAEACDQMIGNLKQAKVYLSKAMERDGKDVFALVYMTEVLDDIGEKTEAVKLRRKKAQMETELTASATRMWY